MNKKQYGLLIFVAFLGGLAGGLVSTKILSNQMAFAQKGEEKITLREISAKTVIAEEYFLYRKKETSPLDSEIPLPSALITTEPGGNPKMIIQDSKGNPRLFIGLNDKTGSALEILNEEGERSVLLSEKCLYGEEQSGPSLALLDSNGSLRVQVGLQNDNNPFIALKDRYSNGEKSSRSIDLCLKGKDKTGLSLSGLEGKIRAEIGVDATGTCFLLKDLKGKTRVELGNTQIAFGKEGVFKKQTASDDFTIEQRPISSLVFYSEMGNVLWSAP